MESENRFPALSLRWDERLPHVGSGWGPDRGLGWRCGSGGVPTPLVVVCAGGMRNTLLLLWALQKWQLGFLVSLYLLPRICPSCVHAVSFSPIRFLCILLLQERVVQVQVLQPRVPDPSLSHQDDGSVLLCLLGECL